MTRFTPLFVNERSAAHLLDMKAAEFRALVQAEHLPKPRQIGGHERWDVEALRNIASGEMAERGGMDW